MQTGPLIHRLDKALKSHPHLVRQRVYIEREQDRIVLRGTVDSYYHKQMVQETVRKIDGIGAIRNLIEVQSAGTVSSR
jgi:osmotically-inducible protein OsmY